MDHINHHLQLQLQKRLDNNSFRQLPGAGAGIDFCSNDYLGLAREEFPAVDHPLFAATGSRLISGNHAEYSKLETLLAASLQAEAALIFGSGYQANLGLLSSIATRHDTMLYDELAHASIRDALRLSNARSFAFRHNDVDHLAQKLENASGRVWVIVESVYSMDGDEAPLADLLACCEQTGAALIVDEAHALGVLGPQGEGAAVAAGLADKIWARIVTFGKAMGSHGAAVLGSALLRDYLVNFSRPFIYTTGLPPDSLYRSRKALECLRETGRREILHQKIKQFQQGLRPDIRNQLIQSRSAIQSLVIPGNDAVKTLAGTLQREGFHILPILHPTVPRGSERLRICLHSFNREADIDRLARTLNEHL